MDAGQSGRLTVLCGAGCERAIGSPALAMLGGLDERLTMSVERLLPILGFKVSIASGRLLVLVVENGADQMQRDAIAHQPGSHGSAQIMNPP